MENEEELKKAGGLLAKLSHAKRRKRPGYAKDQSERAKKRWEKVMAERRRKSGLPPIK